MHKKYPTLIILVHWLTASLILMGVTFILLREVVEGRAIRLWLLDAHKTVGLLIPLVLTVRVFLVMKYHRFFPQHALGQLSKVASKIVHFVLYAGLLSVPLLGWALISAKGQQASWLGVIPLPAIVEEDLDFADVLSDWHAWAGYAFIALVLLHILAVLWHHLIQKDPVLQAMSPLKNKLILTK